MSSDSDRDDDKSVDDQLEDMYDYDTDIDDDNDAKGGIEIIDDADDADNEEEDDELQEDIEEEEYNTTSKLLKYKVNKIIPNEKRVTSDRLTQFEFAGIIAKRVEQISKNNNYLGNDKTLTNPYDMAIDELRNNKLPFIVSRCINVVEEGETLYCYCERWKLSEMIIPDSLYK